MMLVVSHQVERMGCFEDADAFIGLLLALGI
jgi:hypothetical protein